MNKLYKKITLLSIKYGPSIVALTCSIKIFLITYSVPGDTFSYTVSLINLLIFVLLIGVLYCEGKFFHYCWKHRSLCRVALWGCIFYLDLLLCLPPPEEVRAITILYLIGTICITIWYKNI